MKILPHRLIVNNLLLIILISMNGQNTCLAIDTKTKNIPTVAKQNLKKSDSLSGTEIKVGDYRMNLPESIVLKSHGKRGSEDFYLLGASSSSVQGPNQTLLMVQIKPFCSILENQSDFFLSLIYRAYIWGMSLSAGLSKFQQTEPSTIAINGLSFAKGSWSGTKSDNQLRLHGISYVTVSSGKLIGIHAMTPDISLLKLAEEGILTFHK